MRLSNVTDLDLSQRIVTIEFLHGMNLAPGLESEAVGDTIREHGGSRARHGESAKLNEP